MTDRHRLAAALAVLAGVTAFLFWPVVFAGAWFEWDVPEQYWPDLSLLCRSLHSFDIPYWNPWDRGGYPYYADPQAATWHPLNWGICAVAGADPGPGWAGLRVVVGFFVAGLFGLLWLRRLELGWGPALLGAVVIEVAPFMRHNWELNLTLGLAFLPMMLWAAEGLIDRGRSRDSGLLALAAALCVWSGSPPAAWLAGTFTLGYVACRLFEEGRGGLERSGRALVDAVAVAAALVAVVLVPTLRLSGESVQAGRDFDSVAAGALEPAQLLALVTPQPGNHLYVGLIPLVLAAVALAKGRVRGRWFFAGASVLAVLMALGPHTPVFRLAHSLVPGVDLFRLPHRYEAWLGPAVGALAASGLTWLGQQRWRRSATLPVAAVLAVLVVLDVSRSLPPERHTRTGPHPGVDASVLHLAPGTDSQWRYLDEFGISCRSGTRLQRRDLRGYQDPLQLASFERVIGSLREHPRLAEQFSVRYVLSGPHFIHGWNRHFMRPPGELQGVDRGDGVIELPNPMPSAWFVPADLVESASDRSAALARVREVAPAMVAVLEDDVELAAGPGIPVAADSFALEPDRVVVQLPDHGPGLVVVNEAWYPGWEATVDGQAADIVRVNGFVRGVPVAAGARTVELTFAPSDGAPLRWFLLLGWIACIAMLASGRIRGGGDR